MTKDEEPVGWVYPEGLEALKAGKPWTAYGTRQEPNNTALYLSPQPDIAQYAWVTFTPHGDEDDVWYENPEGQLLEGWTYKPLYDTTPPQPDERLAQPDGKQLNAYKLLVKSLEEQLSYHRSQAEKYREAIATLQSERQANAVLTEEVAAAVRARSNT